jgi:hypothetical protein
MTRAAGVWLFFMLCVSFESPCWAAKPNPGTALPERHATRPIPEATYWFAGAALGSFATAGILLGSALSSLNHAHASCGTGCPVGERRAIDMELRTSDMIGGVGLISATLAVLSYWSRPTLAPPSGTIKAGGPAAFAGVLPIFQSTSADRLPTGALVQVRWAF